MTSDKLIFAALLVGTVLLDGMAQPRATQSPFHGRSIAGLVLLAIMQIAIFGLFLAISGNVPVSAALALALQALFVVVSNAKFRMLGEPLLFSDVALLGAVARHPQFYFSALRPWQRAAMALIAAMLSLVLVSLFVPAWQPHLGGAMLHAASSLILAVGLLLWPFRGLAHAPNIASDFRRLGLIPSMLLYWIRWLQSSDPPPCAPLEKRPRQSADCPELLVIVQCESFADPVELFGDPSFALPGLASARADAWQWGKLKVSGFGAYTMRTEYGVLFGRDEDELGFRQYDPFLKALSETSYALPARLKGAGWRSHFLHPHDMRFYGRDRIMPAGGFEELLGEECFAPPAPGDGQYVTDAAVAAEILARASAASSPTLLYAVTMENHGPWVADPASGATNPQQYYLRLVRKSDAMLAQLRCELATINRPSMLVFFGDHRPSIPGVTAPGTERHTPYVILRTGAKGEPVGGMGREIDLTPAGLHHTILNAV